MRRGSLILIGVLVILTGLFVTFVLPPYILNLVEHPDGSYLSALLTRHQLKNPELHTSAYYASYIPAVARRLLFTLSGLAFVIGIYLTRWRRHLLAFWRTPSTAFNLGVLRLLVVWQVVTFPLDAIYALPQFTADGLSLPIGYGWIRGFAPLSAFAIAVAMRAFYVVGGLAFFGVFTRLTVPLLTAIAFWTMLGSQLVGKMHHFHHLWLALAALSLSPCGDALSVDALWRRWRTGRRPSVAASNRYGRAFVLLWSTMGLIYFFPGYWKFVVGGFEWAFSDNVQLKILAKAFETGQEPNVPLYNYPWICRFGGLATIIFEMAFPFAMVFPRARALFALAGVGFHEGNRQTMQIGFSSLEWFYLSFVDWSGLGRRIRGQRAVIVKRRERLRGGFAGAVLLGGLVVTGFASIDSWPWAVYPTFAAIEQNFVNSIELHVIDGSGVAVTLLQNEPALIEAYQDRTRLRAYLTLVMMERDAATRRRMLDGLLALITRAHPRPPTARVEFWQTKVPLLPRGAPTEPYLNLGTY